MSKKVTQPRLRRWRNHPRQKRSPRRPTLRFSPTAWAKLLFLRDRGPTEIGAFGITSPDDLLRVQEIVLVRQNCTESFVSFDDLAVAEFFEEQVDQGRRPEQFARVWIHSHPGESSQPSLIDEETFNRVFGNCDWAVMFIIARGGECFAELHWRHGGAASIPLRIEIDFSQSFPASNAAVWAGEYDAQIRIDRQPMSHHEIQCDREVSDEKQRRFPDHPQSFADHSLMHSCALAWEMS